MDISLKLCGIEDLDTLRELSIRTYYETFAALNTPENMQEYLLRAFNKEKLLEELTDKNSKFFLLYCGEKLAGYIKVNEAPSQTDINDPNSLELERIYVTGEFQGQGLGGYLMQKAVSIAVERHKKYIWLGVWKKTKTPFVSTKRRGFMKSARTPLSWVKTNKQTIS